MASYSDWAARWRVPLQFLLAALVLVLARPTPRLLSAGAAVVVLGLAVRAWAAGHLRKDKPLTVSGPYAYLRHPLYFGSALMLAGFALASSRAWLAALLVGYFLFLFVPVMRREERERQKLSPEGYPAYAAQVPAFWPPWRPARVVGEGGALARFDLQLYRRNREWRATLGAAAALLVLYARMFWG